MASTNKTPHLQLSQWIGTDKIRREDFNGDNLKIDTAYEALRDYIEQREELMLYVSPTGSDTTGDGSESNPYRTVQYALSESRKYKVLRGTNIILAPGTYSENISLYGGQNLTISSSSGHYADTILTGATGDPVIKANGVLALAIQNLTIRNDVAPTASGLSIVTITQGNAQVTGCLLDSSQAQQYHGITYSYGSGGVGQLIINNMSHALRVIGGGIVSANANSGSNNATAYSTYAGMMTVLGTKPTATTPTSPWPTGTIFGG